MCKKLCKKLKLNSSEPNLIKKKKLERDNERLLT